MGATIIHCISGFLILCVLHNIIQIESAPEVSKVVCPNQNTTCGEGQTCMWNVKKREWWCCDFPNGVVCSDGDYCCRAGYCDADQNCQNDKDGGQPTSAKRGIPGLKANRRK